MHMYAQLFEPGPLVHTHNVKSSLADCCIIPIVTGKSQKLKPFTACLLSTSFCFYRLQYNMVKEALNERANLLEIAPHLAYPLPIMLPVYKYVHTEFLVNTHFHANTFISFKVWSEYKGEYEWK